MVNRQIFSGRRLVLGQCHIVAGLVIASLMLRLAVIFCIPWSNSSDLNNYFWDAERVVSQENPYLLWRDNPRGPRSDIMPLELLLLSGVIRLWNSPHAIRVFFALCDVVILLLLANLFREKPTQQMLWLTFYGLGIGSLYLFVLTPSDKPLLFAMILLILIQTKSDRAWLKWSNAITLGLLASLKWIGLAIALPILHFSSRPTRRVFMLSCMATVMVFVLSHSLWFGDWQIMYEFRSSRLAMPPFHAGVAIVLQQLGLPMPRLYFLLMVSSWAVVNLAYYVGWIDWIKALGLSLWAFVYWTPDCTPQMLLFISMVLLLGVNWGTWKHAVIIWLGMIFETWVSASSVYMMIGGPIDLQWATALVGTYGSVRIAILSQFLILMCLLLIIRDSLLKSSIATKRFPLLGVARRKK